MARATTKTQTGKSLFTAELIIPAIGDAFKKLTELGALFRMLCYKH